MGSKWRDAHPTYATDYARAYRRANPIAYEAHKAVRTALRNGTLKRAEFCSVCRVPCEPVSHHRDYSKPLRVKWVCRWCHKEIHRKLRNRHETKTTNGMRA